MTQPVPEESNEALHLTEPPADEHGDELPDEADDGEPPPSVSEENAGPSSTSPPTAR